VCRFQILRRECRVIPVPVRAGIQKSKVPKDAPGGRFSHRCVRAFIFKWLKNINDGLGHYEGPVLDLQLKFHFT